MQQTQQENKQDSKVGDLVKFKMNSMNGQVTRAGTVKRILENGSLDIKMQLGGYCILKQSEIIK